MKSMVTKMILQMCSIICNTRRGHQVANSSNFAQRTVDRIHGRMRLIVYGKIIKVLAAELAVYLWKYILVKKSERNCIVRNEVHHGLQTSCTATVPMFITSSSDRASTPACSSASASSCTATFLPFIVKKMAMMWKKILQYCRMKCNAPLTFFQPIVHNFALTERANLGSMKW